MARRGNGEGTIYYSEKLNKWVGQFVAGRKNNGSINRKSVYGNTRKEVKEKMTQKLAEIQNSTFIEKSDITLMQIIKLSNEEKFKLNKIKGSTYNRILYTSKIIEKLDIANMPIQKITRKDLNNSLTEIGDYSQSVINKIYQIIAQAFNYALLSEYIYKNPFLIKGNIIKPNSSKEKKKVIALTLSEEKQFLKALESSDIKSKVILYIAIFSGMRIGEILALKNKDIDLKNKLIYVNKSLTVDENGKVITGSTKTYAGTRDVPILDILYNALKNLSFNNENISKSIVDKEIKYVCKIAKIKNISVHVLRHTFATRCIEAGMQAIVLQKILGHSNIQTTLNIYADVFNEFKEEEVNKTSLYFNATFNATSEKKHKKQ